jgi:protein-S-isoprenylcysteine O-methyltransferase Ste14
MSDKTTRFDFIKLKLTTAIGYLLPFMASLPPLAAWGGLMTVPFIIYLLMMFSNISSYPPLPDFTRPGTLFMFTLAGVGLILLLYSVVYLLRNKSAGLVTGGPYRLCRHPQYFSLIILTLVMTYQSIWILQHTFGIGWLTANQTRILWILMLCAYVVIAWVEEMHLEKQFGQEWTDYRRGKGFLLPSLYFNSYILEASIAIIIPYLVLEAWLSLAPILMEALIIL